MARADESDTRSRLIGNAALNACKECSGINCCGHVCQGGSLEPPFLTPHDIDSIRRFTALPESSFIDMRINPATGNHVPFLETRDAGGCIFFDQLKGKCGVYAVRPIDCMLFPLDITQSGTDYYWIRYKYERCRLTSGDEATLNHLRTPALEILGDQLRDYATVPVPGMDDLECQVLGTIRGTP